MAEIDGNTTSVGTQIIDMTGDIYIGKSVKVLDKVGARTSELDALGAAQIIHLKNRSSFKQLRTHIL
jgi:hypothetical protein